jgi:hypothetical protein
MSFERELTNFFHLKYNDHVEIPQEACAQSSKQGEFHPLLLTEPYVNLSIHTALQDASFN